jgi:hypothetical protein
MPTNTVRVSKSDFPPASADTYVHLEAFGVAVSVRVPKLPVLAVRSSQRLRELQAVL